MKLTKNRKVRGLLIAAAVVVAVFAMAMYAIGYTTQGAIGIFSPAESEYHVGDTVEYTVQLTGPSITPDPGDEAIVDATGTVDVHVHIPSDPYGGQALISDDLTTKPGYKYIWTSTRYVVKDSSDTTITDVPLATPVLSHVIESTDVTMPVAGTYQIRASSHYIGTLAALTVTGNTVIEDTEQSGSTIDTVIMPGTEITIGAAPSMVASGGLVTWTVTETNDGPSSVPLTSPYVNVDASTDNDDDGDVHVLDAADTHTGDAVNPGVLDFGETWTWTYTTNPTADQNLIATGHGLDPLGADVTYDPPPTAAGVIHDAEEQDSGSVDVIHPTTVTSINSNLTALVSGTATLTITEQNDGDVDLTNPYVNVDADGGDNGDVAVLDATDTHTGDAVDPGVLNVGETWTWVLPVTPVATTTYTATGHGMDPLDNDITFPADADERDAVMISVYSPTTVTTISSNLTTITASGMATLTVTEENDGDVDLTSPYVNVDADGGDNGDVAVLDATDTHTGDAVDPGVLNVGETWTWLLPVTPGDTTTYTATGHGMDPLDNDITYPADADERDAVRILVIHPTTIATVGSNVTTIVPSGMATLTVTEENDGDVDLANPYVNVDADGGDNGDVAVLDAADAHTGDAVDPGVLNVGETWTWLLPVTPVDTTTYTITGHGMDPLGNDITFPADAQERDSVTVTVERQGGATRTVGYWQTHLTCTTEVLADCGGSLDMGWSMLNNVPEVMGVLWSQPAKTSEGLKRSKLASAKIIASRQLVAAELNTCLENGAPIPDVMYGGNTMSLIDATILALQTSNTSEILRLAGLLDMYNNSGDDVPLMMTGCMAMPQDSKMTADFTKPDMVF